MAIPKLIHYCWFGGKPLPKEYQQYIAGWKEKMPDYDIVEWNERNFDVDSSIPYVREAFSAQKYAFVSDYVRLKALYEYGGIYLDTDVEILNNPADLLNNNTLVTGFEMEDMLITAFIAVEPGHPLIEEFLRRYENRHFILEDGSHDLTTINQGFTSLLAENGMRMDNTEQTLEGGIRIFPYTVFCGYDVENSHPRITSDTYTVHHFQASWKKMDFRTWLKFKVVVKILQMILGYDNYDKLKKRLKI